MVRGDPMESRYVLEGRSATESVGDALTREIGGWKKRLNRRFGPRERGEERREAGEEEERNVGKAAVIMDEKTRRGRVEASRVESSRVERLVRLTLIPR